MPLNKKSKKIKKLEEKRETDCLRYEWIPDPDQETPVRETFFKLGDWDDKLYQSLTHESYVNGFWIAVLNDYFSPPEFFIQPELRLGNSSRVDLMVSKLEKNVDAKTLKFTPVIVFEGKSADPSHREETLREQTRRYAATATSQAAHNLDHIWCISATGQFVAFYHFRRTSTNGTMRPICVDQEGVLKIGKIRDESQRDQWFNVGEECGKVQFICRFIAEQIMANSTPDSTEIVFYN
ncbi:unnamed protein product [Rhizoctonia solani]|uniref:Uncharacterized protein n=1 Tax=Rhizoctonia solani TaxID=456999 RepID=A0A8H3GLQ5_9AGAM|nr:unnamed protein product [Rhizoctonia solani]